MNIEEIAREAGLSTATVSRVFNRRPNVSASARHRVLDAAERMGYRPRHSAMKETIAIAVQGRDALGFGGYVSMVMSALSRQILDSGYHMEIVTSEDLPLINENMVRGVISLLYGPDETGVLKGIAKVPLISINAPAANGVSLLSDEEGGVAMALARFKEAGHRIIGLPGYPGKGSWAARERHSHFHRLGKEEGLVTLSDSLFNMESVARMVSRGCTAFLAAGEEKGIRLLHYLRLLDKAVPRDAAVITHERSDVNPYAHPPLTSLSQDFDGMAEQMIRLIKDGSYYTRMKGRAVTMAYSLISRESV